MGRHSAPDDALDDDAPGALAVAAVSDVQLGNVVTFRRGRHARDDDEPEAVAERAVPTAGTEPPVAVADSEPVAVADAEPVAVADAEPVAVADAEPAAARPAGGGSAADLRLVREHADVRARCLAAVVVPFAAYVVVFAALGRLGVSALLWIWIPLITAGVLVGVFLDAGHKRYGPDAAATASEPN